MASASGSKGRTAAATGYRDAKAVINGLFDAIDSDHSGAISRAELVSYCTGLLVGTYHNPMARALLADYGVTGEPGSMANLETMFASIDADGDGHITHDEFVVGLMMHHHATRESDADRNIASAHARGVMVGAVVASIGCAAAYIIATKLLTKSV